MAYEDTCLWNFTPKMVQNVCTVCLQVEKLSSQLIKEREETHIDGSVSAVEVMLKEHLAKIEQFQVTKTLRSHEQQTDSQDFPDKSRAAENKKEVTVVVGVKDGSTSLIEEGRIFILKQFS